MNNNCKRRIQLGVDVTDPARTFYHQEFHKKFCGKAQSYIKEQYLPARRLDKLMRHSAELSKGHDSRRQHEYDRIHNLNDLLLKKLEHVETKIPVQTVVVPRSQSSKMQAKSILSLTSRSVNIQPFVSLNLTKRNEEIKAINLGN